MALWVAADQVKVLRSLADSPTGGQKDRSKSSAAQLRMLFSRMLYLRRLKESKDWKVGLETVDNEILRTQSRNLNEQKNLNKGK